MQITIIGLGLIGGSLALDLKKRGFATHLTGVDNNKKHTQIALQKGIVDRILPLSKALKKAELVILAIPVNASIQLLPKILDKVDNQTIVTDMGSTKGQVIKCIAQHTKRAQFVASHPMAGTEYSGPNAAIYDLFDGKVAIICDKQNSAKEAVQTIETMYQTLKMPLIYMDAQEHDIHAAYVSHISHISSFILAMTVLEKEKSVSNIFNLASGGFASTVRLAKSSPQMWSQIFEQNKGNILEVMDTYIDYLSLWKSMIQEGRFDEIEQMMGDANAIRKILDTPPIERLQVSTTSK